MRKFWLVTISAPREEDRLFVSLAEDEQSARRDALDHVDYEVCSPSVVALEQGILEFDGCVEVCS